METQLPDDFRCPISLEIMSDPVILPSGHTFDRVSIQRWLDSGHRACPITKLPLPEHPLPILISLLDSGLERAIEVLGLLVKCKEGREEMMKVNGCVKVLVSVLRNGSSRGVQYGLFTLNCLCTCCERLCFEAINEGVVEICMGLMEEENEKIRRYTSSLVQTLRENHAFG
ncbi:hypothetical protein GOBAR_DD10768 [Gossypium barbadense]|nr:hypothetical protein GOBAR_DD10768 [Gossypium barbadense]